MLKTDQRIITVEDLAEEAGQAIINAQSEPLVVTENGRPKVYLISVDLFDSLVSQLELIEDAELRAYVAAGERQFTQGAYKTLTEATALAETAWQKQASAK